MSWLAMDDDDWLSEAPKPPPIDHLQLTSGTLSSDSQPLDLSGHFEASEPLHTLPEAPNCPIRMKRTSLFQYTSLDVTENVTYYVFKVPSIRHLSNIQNRGVTGVSSYSEMELNMALAKSSHVVLIFSVIGTHTFDGYALMTWMVGDASGVDFNYRDYPPQVNIRPLKVQLVRRGTIPFAQVSHIRDDMGLQGRPVSSAKDGIQLGVAAGRTLCRGIDKKAFKEDPVHYHDLRYDPKVLPETSTKSNMRVPADQLAFASMGYTDYVEWFNRNPCQAAPSLSNILVAK